MKAGQFAGNHISTTINVADTDVTVAHSLGRIAREAFVVACTHGAVIYRGSAAWDSTSIVIRSNTANVGVTLLII